MTSYSNSIRQTSKVFSIRYLSTGTDKNDLATISTLSEESVTFSGKLIMRSVNALKDFENMAKEQKPVRLTLGTGESYQVTIESLNRTKSGFLKDGKYRYQEYSIPLQRYFK